MAAPSRDAVWVSCPQACILPSYTEASGRCTASCWGMASMSARRATAGPSPPARRATAPVLAPVANTSTPGRLCRACKIFCVVRVSSKLSSGWLCRSAAKARSCVPNCSSHHAGVICKAGSSFFWQMAAARRGGLVETFLIVRALRPICKAKAAKNGGKGKNFYTKKIYVFYGNLPLCFGGQTDILIYGKTFTTAWAHAG